MKTCACGRHHTAEQWERLHYVGRQPDGEGGTLELRNCPPPCGSTLAVVLPPEPATVEAER